MLEILRNEISEEEGSKSSPTGEEYASVGTTKSNDNDDADRGGGWEY